MNQLREIQDLLRNLRFGESANNLSNLLEKAEKNNDTYATFLINVLKHEQKRREEKI